MNSPRPPKLGAPVESVAGKQPVFAQTMLRTNKSWKSIEFYESLGMKHVATLPFPEYKFSLYFLVAPDDSSPAPPPLEAPRHVVAEYLWSLRCPTLELTENWPVEDEEPEKFISGHEAPGYEYMTLAGTFPDFEHVASSIIGLYHEKSAIVTDPDGYRVHLLQNKKEDVTYARTVLRINDPAKMVRFFECLGMVKVAVIDDVDAGMSHYFMGYMNEDDVPSPEKDWFDFLDLNKWLANVQAPLVHLKKNWRSPENKLTNGNEKPHRGFGHLGILVDDVATVMKAMEEKGYGVVKPTTKFLDAGTLAFIKDDDMTGYWVEIIQRVGEAPDKPYVRKSAPRRNQFDAEDSFAEW